MKNLKLKVISTIAALSLAVSCGKDSGSGSSSSSGGNSRQEQEPAPLDGSNIQGHYQAKFITLNPHVNGTIPGSANFYRKDDKIFAYVRLFAGGVRAWHMQHVYTGGRCPTMKDDKNGDGFIDIVEAEAVLGNILIPLDSDISSQRAGNRFFPLADLSGYYHYERITSFKRFLADLQAPDPDPNDNIVKLAPDEGLRLEGKTVLIQGVTETVDLPDTVASQGRRRAFQTLPIVCGVYKKLSDAEPGTPYVMDQIPGPIAEVVEGQDRPAEDEIPDTTGGSSGGSSGSGTNDSDDGDGPVSDGNGGTSGRSTTSGSSSGSSSGSTSGSSTTGGSSSGGSTSGGSTSSGSTSGSGSESSSSESSSSSTTGDTTSGESSSSSSTTSTSTSSSSSSTTGGVFGF